MLNRSARLIGVVITAALVTAACTPGTDPTTTVAPATTTTASGTTITVETTTTNPTEPSTDSADLVFFGGPIVTMDPDIGMAEALAVTGDRIVAVGDRADIEILVDASTEVVDLAGRTLLPGFVDPHSHALSDAVGFEDDQQRTLAAGITTIADGSVEPDLYDEFVTRARSDAIRVRLLMYAAITDPCGVPYDEWWKNLTPGPITDRLSLAGVKIFSDGSFVCGAVAASEPWAPGATIGPPYQEMSTLRDWIVAADERSLQVVVHAQGDLAIERVLDAYESALEDSDTDLRHRIDHNTFVTPESAVRYREIGVVPVVFGGSPACTDLEWTDFFKEFGERPNTIIEAAPGTIVAWHSDDPAWPPDGTIPDLYSLVTRSRLGDDGQPCTPEPWMTTGGVTIDQAVQMMTINAAYALGREAEIGSLTPGKLADLIVLSANPLTTPPDDLLDLTVLTTIVGGVTEHCSPGSESLCPYG